MVKMIARFTMNKNYVFNFLVKVEIYGNVLIKTSDIATMTLNITEPLKIAKP